MLEVRHFEMVEAIVGAGTVTGAARRLHLTQPAVSHGLADLERRLGVTLFRREPRGMVLTREGERVLAAGRVVLSAVREAEHDLELYREGCQGVVRVSTQCYTCYHWLPPILAHFAERLPEIEVQIVPDATDDPIRALLDERLDLAIVHSPVTEPELVSEVLFEDELVAVLPPGHGWAERARLDPEDFRNTVLLLHSDPEESTVWTDFLAPAGVRPERVLTLQLTEAVLQAAKAGLGITVMARWAVAPDLHRGEVVALRLGEEGLHRTWRLVTRRDLSHRTSLQELAGLLKEDADPDGMRGFHG